MMRIVVGSESSSDMGQVELDRHAEMLAMFAKRIEAGARGPRCITMILRSPASNAAQAFIARTSELKRAGIFAQVLVAALEPESTLRLLYACLSELSPKASTSELIRSLRNPRLLDAHEQVTYGKSLCWWGDAMRREADKRNALSLFEDGSNGSVRRGQLAFHALWSASTAIPERRLLARAMPRPSGAYERDRGTVAAVSTLRPSLQGWPLIRH